MVSQLFVEEIGVAVREISMLLFKVLENKFEVIQLNFLLRFKQRL